MPFFIVPKGSAEILQFDVFLSETHEHAATVTTHPIEAGSDKKAPAEVSDHVKQEPDLFSISVFVSNSPISEYERSGNVDGYGGAPEIVELTIPKFEPEKELTPGTAFRLIGQGIRDAANALLGGPPALKAQLLTFASGFDAVREAQEKLIALKRGAFLCDLFTMSREYSNMLLQRVSVPRDQAGGASIQLDFREIQIAQSETVAAPQPKEPRGAPVKSKGGQAGKPVEGKDAVKSASAAVKALEAFGYAMIEIPLFPETPLYTEHVTIDGRNYVFRFDWIGRENRWRFDIGDDAGNWLATGIKVVCGVPLLRKSAVDGLPDGHLMAVDFSNQNDNPPDFYDLGRRVRLVYTPKASAEPFRVTQPGGA